VSITGTIVGTLALSGMVKSMGMMSGANQPWSLPRLGEVMGQCIVFLPPDYDTVPVTYYFRLGINVILIESGEIERFVLYVGRCPYPL
jgi:hypothetical protein